jgi:hypothetical protein
MRGRVAQNIRSRNHPLIAFGALKAMGAMQHSNLSQSTVTQFEASLVRLD